MFIEKIKSNIKYRVVLAILLDCIDFFIAPVPVLNSAWDVITAWALRKVLRHPNLAGWALSELLLPGIPGLAAMDATLPAATILVVVDELVE